MRHASVAFLLVSAVQALSAQEATAPLPSAVIPAVAEKVRRNIDLLDTWLQPPTQPATSDKTGEVSERPEKPVPPVAPELLQTAVSVHDRAEYTP